MAVVIQNPKQCYSKVPIGFARIPISNDGDCLFHALGKQLEIDSKTLRNEIYNKLQDTRITYSENIKNAFADIGYNKIREWAIKKQQEDLHSHRFGGTHEIVALTEINDYTIIIYTPTPLDIFSCKIDIYGDKYTKCLYLFHCAISPDSIINEHYEGLIPLRKYTITNNTELLLHLMYISELNDPIRNLDDIIIKLLGSIQGDFSEFINKRIKKLEECVKQNDNKDLLNQYNSEQDKIDKEYKDAKNKLNQGQSHAKKIDTNLKSLNLILKELQNDYKQLNEEETSILLQYKSEIQKLQKQLGVQLNHNLTLSQDVDVININIEQIKVKINKLKNLPNIYRNYIQEYNKII